MSDDPNDGRWWRREEAARYLNLAPKTLANMATAGKGPRFKRFSGGLRGGSVRYRREWCDDYVMASGATPPPPSRGGRPPAIR